LDIYAISLMVKDSCISLQKKPWHSSKPSIKEAFAAHTKLLSRARSLVKLPPHKMAINPIPDNGEPFVVKQEVNFLTLQRAILKVISWLWSWFKRS